MGQGNWKLTKKMLWEYNSHYESLPSDEITLLLKTFSIDAGHHF
jgi:hypothetical protein